MNQTRGWLAWILLAALAAPVFAATNEWSRPRIWTSASGAKMPAIFSEISGDDIILKNRQGEPIRIARAKLSGADQALLDEAFGPASPGMPEAPPPEEFGPAAPAPDAAPDSAATVENPSPAAPSPLRVAETEIPLETKTTFRTPLDKEAMDQIRKVGNKATEAVVGLWLPADFDPKQEWGILLVSATANSSSIGHMSSYLTPAKTATGWIVVAADGPEAPVKGDDNVWRWQMARAALLALQATWPDSRQWPVAVGGFSGGAKRSGYLGALLCKDEWNLIGMYMGGCNEDMASEGLREYRPDRGTFRRVPVYLSTGKKDATATVNSANKVRLSLGATGFRDVRMETYDGAHVPNAPQIAEALTWFKELRAKRAAKTPAPLK